MLQFHIYRIASVKLINYFQLLVINCLILQCFYQFDQTHSIEGPSQFNDFSAIGIMMKMQQYIFFFSKTYCSRLISIVLIVFGSFFHYLVTKMVLCIYIFFISFISVVCLSVTDIFCFRGLSSCHVSKLLPILLLDGLYSCICISIIFVVIIFLVLLFVCFANT